MIQIKTKTSEYCENRKLLVQILKTSKRGYMQTINFKYPKLKKWIFETTKFLDMPNRKFTTRLWYIVNNLNSYPICEVCKKPITKDIYRLTDPRMDFCSHKCSSNSNHTLNSRVQTTLKRYGCEYAAQCENIQKKSYATRIKNGNIAKPKIFKDKCKSRKKNFYNNVILKNKYVFPLFSENDYINETSKTKKFHEFTWRCKCCGNIFSSKMTHFYVHRNDKTFARCLKCHPYHKLSSCEERHLAEYIKNQFSEKFIVIHNKEENMKTIYPYQLDILLLDKKTNQVVFAIEYNGSRWHSLQEGSNIDRQLKKTILCENKNITLIHIYEDEWLYKNAKIKKFLHKILENKLVFKKQKIYLPRDKYPKTVVISGFKFVKNSEIHIHRRKSIASNLLYDVPDCGTSTYERI